MEVFVDVEHFHWIKSYSVIIVIFIIIVINREIFHESIFFDLHCINSLPLDIRKETSFLVFKNKLSNFYDSD